MSGMKEKMEEKEKVRQIEGIIIRRNNNKKE